MSAEGSRRPLRLWAAAFWALVWQLGSMALDSALLLPSPLLVLRRLLILCPTPLFWRAVLFSAARIAGGFLLSLLTGLLLALLACRRSRVEELLSPLVLTIKSVPVASFTILALVWVSSRNLSLLIAFLMALPVIYTNALTGLRAADGDLLEMAQVFRLSPLRRLRFLRLPALWPYLSSACSVAAGLSWKAGVAAEVIGLPAGSIGDRLQQAKICLDTADLFAWTAAVALLSAAFEGGIALLLRVGRRVFQEV